MIVVVGYTEYGMIHAIINGKDCFIPDDESLSDRRLVSDWEALGNTIPTTENSKSQDQNITEAPDTLFGGPSLGEIYNGS